MHRPDLGNTWSHLSLYCDKARKSLVSHFNVGQTGHEVTWLLLGMEYDVEVVAQKHRGWGVRIPVLFA